MSDRSRQSSITSLTRAIVVVLALLLPTISLVPLGGLYLWEKGYLLWWAAVALLVVSVISLLQWRLLRRSLPNAALQQPKPENTIEAAPDASWPPAQQRAWEDVRAIAAKVDIDKIGSPEELLEIAQSTIDAVARRLHPGKEDALWRFTLPEALAITERVSRRLGDFVVDNVPFGDRLTVSQFLSIYRWRHMLGVAERAYDVWRVIRLANPVTAVAHETRERLSRALYHWGREHVMRRLVEAYVEEVGRAAIDLYSGRLRFAHRTRSEEPAGIQEPPPPAAGVISPVRFLVAGADAGRRMAVADALSSVTARRKAELLQRPDDNAATSEIALLTGIGVRASKAGGGRKGLRRLMREVDGSDALIWLVPLLGGPPSADKQAVAAISSDGLARPGSPPPLLIPAVYGPATADTSQAPRAVRGLLGEYAGGMVPLAIVAGEATSPDIDSLWQAVVRAVPAVQSVVALRQQRARKGAGWLGAGQQALGAIGGLGRHLFGRR